MICGAAKPRSGRVNGIALGESVGRRKTRLVVLERILARALERASRLTSRRSQMKRPTRLRRTCSGLNTLRLRLTVSLNSLRKK